MLYFTIQQTMSSHSLIHNRKRYFQQSCKETVHSHQNVQCQYFKDLILLQYSLCYRQIFISCCRTDYGIWTGLSKINGLWGSPEGKAANYSLWADGHPTTDFDFSIWKKNETLVEDPTTPHGQICQTKAISMYGFPFYKIKMPNFHKTMPQHCPAMLLSLNISPE